MVIVARSWPQVDQRPVAPTPKGFSYLAYKQECQENKLCHNCAGRFDSENCVNRGCPLAKEEQLKVCGDCKDCHCCKDRHAGSGREDSKWASTSRISCDPALQQVSSVTGKKRESVSKIDNQQSTESA
ncbi:uncharacterized protein VP01_1387g1 [Puccinia sorghi]|uniref:Uncharacterized protein n=1 Tax=Puccinia sorghi TaxID=27349 RepID=A0A0L6VLE7_9BASI|nr:uncharacterized protein VP01_1387g1 [Puccinia sorghi]